MSRLYLYLIASAAVVAIIFAANWRGRIEGRADLAREIAAAAAEKRLADNQTKELIQNEINGTADADLADRIVNGGWLLETD